MSFAHVPVSFWLKQTNKQTNKQTKKHDSGIVILFFARMV